MSTRFNLGAIEACWKAEMARRGEVGGTSLDLCMGDALYLVKRVRELECLANGMQRNLDAANARIRCLAARLELADRVVEAAREATAA
jgi:hypothetical protein